jgi:hypothetical protein
MSKEIYCTGHVTYPATSTIAAETVTIVADLDIDDVAGYDGATEDLGGARTLAAIATRVEMPRNVVITVTDADASITAGHISVSGLNASGYPVREQFDMVSGAGTTTFTGNQAYSEISAVICWGFAGVTNADDNIKVGVGDKIGLPMGKDCELIDVFAAHHGGAKEAVLLSGINRTYGTYTGTSAAGAGDHEMEFWYTYKHMLNW